MNADPVVMEHFFHGVRTRDETAEFMARIEQEFERRGFGLWAIEVPGTAPFIGFVGLHEAVFEAPFTPAVEVGWRLARQFWEMATRPRLPERRSPSASIRSGCRKLCLSRTLAIAGRSG